MTKQAYISLFHEVCNGESTKISSVFITTREKIIRDQLLHNNEKIERLRALHEALDEVTGSFWIRRQPSQRLISSWIGGTKVG